MDVELGLKCKSISFSWCVHTSFRVYFKKNKEKTSLLELNTR